MKSFIPVSYFEAWKLDGPLYSSKNTITLNDDPGTSSLDVLPFFFSNFSTTYTFGDTKRHTDHWEINAGFGNDIINAAASTENNILLGGAGNDDIIGGSGDDRLDGGLGDDVLTGNEGADTFVMSKGYDVVNDFNHEKVVIDFEDIGVNPSDPYTVISENYHGLVWETFDPSSPAEAQPIATIGNVWDDPGELWNDLAALSDPTDTANNILYDSAGQGLAFSDENNDFNLEQADIGVLYGENATVRVGAWDDGVMVGYEDIELNGPATIDFTEYGDLFTSIDKVSFDCIESTSTDPAPGGAVYDYVGVDNVVLSYGDVIDAPDGCDVDAMIASAADNGDGGSSITCGDATMELIGVPPAELDAAMFT